MVQQNIAEPTEQEEQVTPLAETEAPVEEPKQPETPPTEAEPDWKAKAEEFRIQGEQTSRELERERQLRKQFEGRLAKDAETNRRLLRTETYARHSVPEEERADLDKQAAAAAAEEAQRDIARAEVEAMTEEIEEYASRIGKPLATDPAFAYIRELNGQYRYGTALREIRKLYEADLTSKETARATAQEAARKVAAQARQERANLASPRPAGNAAAATDETIDKLWVDFDKEHPGVKNPYDAQYRALLNR